MDKLYVCIYLKNYYICIYTHIFYYRAFDYSHCKQTDSNFIKVQPMQIHLNIKHRHSSSLLVAISIGIKFARTI